MPALTTSQAATTATAATTTTNLDKVGGDPTVWHRVPSVAATAGGLTSEFGALTGRQATDNAMGGARTGANVETVGSSQRFTVLWTTGADDLDKVGGCETRREVHLTLVTNIEPEYCCNHPNSTHSPPPTHLGTLHDTTSIHW